MKTILIIILFLLSVLLYSETNSQLETNIKPISFQYSISNYLNLAPFDGSIFTIKYHINEFNAIRVGLTGNLYVNNIKNTLNIDSNFIFYNISINIDYINYLFTRSMINVYYGVGPVISINMNDAGYQTLPSIGKYYNAYYLFGIEGLIGLEWFINNNISLFVESGIISSFSFTNKHIVGTDSNNTISTNIDYINNSTLNIKPNNINLGLSIYI